MRFPLVTRSRFEYEQRHIKLLKVMLTETAEEMKALRVHYGELVKTVVEMKKEGFEPVPKPIELIPEKDLPAPIWEAINEVSVHGSREYYAHMAHAHEAIEAKVAHEIIIRQILYGQDVEV